MRWFVVSLIFAGGAFVASAPTTEVAPAVPARAETRADTDRPEEAKPILVAFSQGGEVALNPSRSAPMDLGWYAIAKGDYGTPVVQVAAYFSNADGTVTRPVEPLELAPGMPQVVRGRGASGVIRLGREDELCRAIRLVAELPDSPGVDRVCLVVTIVCSRRGRVTGQDSDVLHLVLE